MYQETNFKQSIGTRILLWLVPLVGAMLAMNAVVAIAAESEQGVFANDAVGKQGQAQWGLAYENDFLVPGGNDRDYTFGFALSYDQAKSGSTRSAWHGALAKLDGLVGIQSSAQKQGVELGFYGFTPAEKSSKQVNFNDRPFASLVYFSVANERVRPLQNSYVRTQISVGVLGLNIVPQAQDAFHQLIGNERPRGWGNQISNGGELTARYAITEQRLLYQAASGIELRQSSSASIGYLTEASWGLSLRLGKFNSRWHDFNPALASYAESSSSSSEGRQERFFWAGFALKARAYNAFLQGQFRYSAHSFSGSRLNRVIVEAWAGYTQSFANGYFISYGLRGHSSEVEQGEANRNVVWGGLKIGKRVI